MWFLFAAYVSGDWPSAPVDRPAEIAALEEYMFTLTGESSERKGIRTNAILIARGGTIVYEKYARGFTERNRQLSWSVAKSVTNALVGVAVQQGRLNIDAPIDGWGLDPRVTTRGLLEFSSGLRWQELYENTSNQASSVLAMLYGMGHKNFAQFVADRGLEFEPGVEYEYSTGSSCLLAAVAQRAMADEGESWPWDRLFTPLGMSSAVFERDASGTLSGGSHFYATPRDYAKFGALFMQDGVYEGQRILPEGWVAASTQISSAYMNSANSSEDGAQGLQWWINYERPQDERLSWPDVPADAFAALGHWGQSITVIPSLDLIIVRNADDRESDVVDRNRFLALAIAVGRAP